MKKLVVLFSMLACASSVTLAAYDYTIIVSDHFNTAGPNNLLNGSTPDTLGAPSKWVASTKYERKGVPGGSFVHLTENTSAQAGEFALLKPPTTTEKLWQKDRIYALSAAMAVYAQSVSRTGYACFGYRMGDESQTPVGENKLPYVWVDENGGIGLSAGQGNSYTISMSEFVPGFTPGITPVELEYFSLVLNTFSDKWVAKVYYHDELIKFTDGREFALALSNDAQEILEKNGKEGNQVSLFLNTNVDGTKKGTLESGFDDVIFQCGTQVIPEPATYAMLLSLFALGFTAYRVKMRKNK